jgi:Family of unknown function (DUF5678)
MDDRTTPDMAEVLRQRVRAQKELAEHLQNFAGQWVAVKDEEIVAHADSLADLLKTVDPDEVEVFEVAKEQATACFF